MLIEDYILYLEKTVEEQPDKVKKHLIKKFVDANIAQKEHSQQLSLSGMEPINLSDKKLVEQVTECISLLISFVCFNYVYQKEQLMPSHSHLLY